MYLSKIYHLCTHVSEQRGLRGGGDFPKNLSTFVSVTNGELYLQGFEHNGDRVIQSQKSHRSTLCFYTYFGAILAPPELHWVHG